METNLIQVCWVDIVRAELTEREQGLGDLLKFATRHLDCGVESVHTDDHEIVMTL
jgi:hypothetical protein